MCPAVDLCCPHYILCKTAEAEADLTLLFAWHLAVFKAGSETSYNLTAYPVGSQASSWVADTEAKLVPYKL